MSSIHAKFGKSALCLATVAFVLGPLGCAHANTTGAGNGDAQATRQTGSQGTNQSGTASEQSSNQATEAKDLVKFSHHGHAAILSIQEARVAIFNGHPQAAIQLMDKAKTSIDAAEREAPDFALPKNAANARNSAGTRTNSQGAVLVPVDARMSLGEDYTATPEKQSHINKANEHLRNGETKQAMDELKLAGVDVNYTLVLMPIASSKQDLQKAITLAGQGKYYESNLALKSIEDGLLIDTESLIEAPKNGSKNKMSPKSGASTAAPNTK
jgi:3,4-dihydroxy-2-butanone 4-phosphate synthase